MNSIALTFDDGPADWTEPILDLLAEHGARATFFVIGSLAEARTEIVRRMVLEGHEVGNHSWSHPRLADACDDKRVREELRRTNEVLATIIGYPPSRFRAPQYNVDARVAAIAAELGLTHTRGDVRPPDWDRRCTAGFIAAFVLQQVRHGVVVGLHDGLPPKRVGTDATRQPTVEAVAVILPRLLARDFECVTASTLLSATAADSA
jgi:peptidoglycan-N-acetylglucosamine deacetylase